MPRVLETVRKEEDLPKGGNPFAPEPEAVQWLADGGSGCFVQRYRFLVLLLRISVDCDNGAEVMILVQNVNKLFLR